MKLLLACGTICVALASNMSAGAQAPNLGTAAPAPRTATGPRAPNTVPVANEAQVDPGSATPLAATDGGTDGGVPLEADAQTPSVDDPAVVDMPPSAEPLSADAAGATEPVVDSGEGDMVVTGSRIKRTTFAASAPVDVVDRTALARSGATNLADVVQSMTTSQGSGSQGSMTQSGNPASGTVSVNLRGLGEGATLLLINGRRVNPSGASIDTNLTDLSTIPLAAVERIEILKAGASAIYGADAVGGVVNIITRKNYSGFRIEASGQSTTKLDQPDFTGSAVFGASDDRSRVLVAASYLRRGELIADERDWAKDSYRSTQGQPGAYVPATAAGMPIAGGMPDPACGDVPGTRPVPSGASTVCAFDYAEFATLIGNLERANLFGSAEYDLTSHTSVFAEVSASRMRGDNKSSPSLPVLPFPLIPADHVDNPFVVPDGLPNAGQRTSVLWIGRPLGAAAGETRNPFADDSFRAVVGLRGDLEGVAEGSVFESWEWELYTMMGISRYRYTFKDNLREPLLDALNSCSDASDLSGCFNPFHSALDGTGTINTDRVIRSFAGEMMIMNDHALQTYNGGMSGSLFEMPGGDAGIAFGGEIRHEWRTGELEHDANEDRYIFFVGNPDSSMERDVFSGYLELRWPFYPGIELQTAARLEHYTDIESSSVSPFAGLTLTPALWIGRDNAPPLLRRLQLRGNISTAFRAPTILQSASSFQTVPTPLRLSAASPLSTYLPVRRFGNSDLEPERALAVSGGVAWTPIDQLSVFVDVWHYDYVDRISFEDPQQVINEDMAVQDSRVVRDPNGNIVGVNVGQINVSGSTTTTGVDFGLALNLPGGNRPRDSWNLSVGAQGTFTSSYEIPRGEASTRSIPANAATGDPARLLPPLDCEGSSAVDFDMDPNNDGENDQDACEVAGKRNADNYAPPIPRLRVNLPLTFTVAGHSASVIPHVISGMEDDIEPNADGSFDSIDAWFSLDLQYGYTLENVVGEEISLRVGCYNLFDADPPGVNGSAAGYEAAIHDPRGRMIYAKLSGAF